MVFHMKMVFTEYNHYTLFLCSINSWCAVDNWPHVHSSSINLFTHFYQKYGIYICVVLSSKFYFSSFQCKKIPNLQSNFIFCHNQDSEGFIF